MNSTFLAYEILYDLLNNDISENLIEEELKKIGIKDYDFLISRVTAKHLVLTKGDSSHSYTNEEVKWLSYGENVFVYSIRDDIRTFVIQLCCDPIDYYLVSGAMVKIFNMAFPTTKNVFLFKINTFLALGMARSFTIEKNKDFTVSGLISMENIDVYKDMIIELLLLDIEMFPGTIMIFSPNEQEDALDFNNNRNTNCIEYLETLTSIQKSFGVDITYERNRFLVSLEPEKNAIVSYHQAEGLLKEIAADVKKSSYEDLLEAKKFEEDISTKKNKFVNDKNLENLSFEIIEDFSNNAFENAEDMLKEMN